MNNSNSQYRDKNYENYWGFCNPISRLLQKNCQYYILIVYFPQCVCVKHSLKIYIKFHESDSSHRARHNSHGSFEFL